VKRNSVIVYFITDVNNFRTLELVEYLITKVEVFRMAEGEVRITYDTHVFGFSHIGWFWLVW
jgi:hypothetical protein